MDKKTIALIEKIVCGFFWLFGWSLIFAGIERDIFFAFFVWGISSPVMIPFGAYMTFWYFPKMIDERLTVNRKYDENNKEFKIIENAVI